MVQVVHEVGRRRRLKLELGFRWYTCEDLVYTKKQVEIIGFSYSFDLRLMFQNNLIFLKGCFFFVFFAKSRLLSMVMFIIIFFDKIWLCLYFSICKISNIYVFLTRMGNDTGTANSLLFLPLVRCSFIYITCKNYEVLIRFLKFAEEPRYCSCF
ncbi:hypothetical protein Hdeb2414_s0001g00010281 [Helianthus debilis subsp. tardiflorus]